MDFTGSKTYDAEMDERLKHMECDFSQEEDGRRTEHPLLVR